MGKRASGNGSWWQKLKAWLRGSTEPADEPAASLFVPEVVIEGQRHGRFADMAAAEDANAINVVHLRQQMMNHLTEAELAAIATAVSQSYDDFPGGKGRKVLALVQACAANGRLSDLLAQCQQTNPTLDWQPDWNVSRNDN